MRSVRGKSVVGRRDTGDKLRARATATNTQPVKAKLAAFLAVHARYVKADDVVTVKEVALHAKEAVAAELDASLDGVILTLASHLPSVGLPRVNPMKPLGFDAPSVLTNLPWAQEAKQAAALAKKAAKVQGATKPITAACKLIADLAGKLQAATRPVSAAREERRQAIAARDTIGIEWARALARLKNAARAAEDDGAAGLYEKLLGDTSARPAKKKAKPVPPVAP